MIDSEVREVLIKALKEKYLTEPTRIKEIIQELAKDIKDFIFQNMTEADREFVKKFPKLFKRQKDISLVAFFLKDIIGEDTVFPIYYSNISGINVMVRFDGNTPNWIRGDRLMEEHKELITRVQPKIKEAYELLKEYRKKYDFIHNTIMSSELTTAEIKRFSPKLWKIYEENK